MLSNLATDIVSAETGEVNWYYPVGLVVLMQTLLYLFCQVVKDNSHIDVMWSLTFIAPNLLIMYAQNAQGMEIGIRSLVTNACITVWGLRLAIHIGVRHTGEDYRYQHIRKRMMKAGLLGYYVLAYLLIFVLQAVLALVVNCATLSITASDAGAAANIYPLIWSDYVGWAVFCIGLIMEAFSDRQLAAHIANPDPNKGKFCKIGFWRYSRHPNYFGDALLWWGLFMVACSLPNGYFYFFSPLFMTILLRYVSGVALLERKQRKHPEFA
jgi:steroid 5-alpha reductase family enzyme